MSTTAERLTPTIVTAREFKVAIDLFELAIAHHGPTEKLAFKDCSICQQRRAKVEEIFATMANQRLLLAKLAACSESPQFFNPLVAFEAQAIRDAVLAAEATI